MARVFVAVWPPASVLDALVALPRPDLPGLRWVPRRNLHVTLRFLGAIDEGPVVERLSQTPLPTAQAAVGRATALLGGRVVVAPVQGLDALASAVTTATADLGQPPPSRPFTAHVTLARCRDPDHARPVTGIACSGRFPVEHVAVVTSHTHPDGARYTTVARIPTGRGVRSHG